MIKKTHFKMKMRMKMRKNTEKSYMMIILKMDLKVTMNLISMKKKKRTKRNGKIVRKTLSKI